MADRSEVLRQIMKKTDTSQSELARFSGVHQPSISQFLSARVDLGDEQLDRLLSCMVTASKSPARDCPRVGPGRVAFMEVAPSVVNTIDAVEPAAMEPHHPG